MSEHITHIAVFEDSSTIMELSTSFHESFVLSTTKFPDSGLFGSATRGNHLHAMPIFDRVRKIWGSHTEDDLKQLSFAIGWVTHRAADLIQKPVVKKTAALEKETGFLEMEHEIYQDAASFKYVYEGGKRSSVSPFVKMTAATLETGMRSHPGASLIDANNLEFKMCGLLHNELLELHTFSSNVENIDSWIDTFFDRRQRLYEDLRIYIKAFQDPDPLRWEKFIDNENYYNPHDEIFQLIRAKQKGLPLPDLSLEEAVNKAESQSQYAQMLALSFKFLQAASDFFSGKINASDTYDTLEIFPESHRLVS